LADRRCDSWASRPRVQKRSKFLIDAVSVSSSTRKRGMRRIEQIGAVGAGETGRERKTPHKGKKTLKHRRELAASTILRCLDFSPSGEGECELATITFFSPFLLILRIISHYFLSLSFSSFSARRLLCKVPYVVLIILCSCVRRLTVCSTMCRLPCLSTNHAHL